MEVEGGQYIGHGEKIAEQVLKNLYPKGVVKTQVLLSELIKKEYKDELNERGEKETIDIVLLRTKQKPLAIRVQDDRHKTKRMCQIDGAQSRVLGWSGVEVLDLHKWACPDLFNDEYNGGGAEIVRELLHAGLL